MLHTQTPQLKKNTFKCNKKSGIEHPRSNMTPTTVDNDEISIFAPSSAAAQTPYSQSAWLL